MIAASSALRFETVLLRQPAGLSFVVAHGKQEHLAGNELVAALLRFPIGDVEQVDQIASDLHVAAVAFDLRQAVDGLIDRRFQRLHVDARLCQQRGRCAVLLLQQGHQQMHRLHHLVVVADSQALCVGQRLLKLGGQFVLSHGECPCQLVRWLRSGGMFPVFKTAKSLCSE